MQYGALSTTLVFLQGYGKERVCERHSAARPWATWPSFFSNICPFQVDGKKEDVSGMALLMPELNAADLTEQGGARELLRQFAEARCREGYSWGGQARKLT